MKVLITVGHTFVDIIVLNFIIGPAETDLVSLNSSWIGLNLYTWSDGNCPISSFVIEYR